MCDLTSKSNMDFNNCNVDLYILLQKKLQYVIIFVHNIYREKERAMIRVRNCHQHSTKNTTQTVALKLHEIKKKVQIQHAFYSQIKTPNHECFTCILTKLFILNIVLFWKVC